MWSHAGSRFTRVTLSRGLADQGRPRARQTGQRQTTRAKAEPQNYQGRSPPPCSSLLYSVLNTTELIFLVFYHYFWKVDKGFLGLHSFCTKWRTFMIISNNRPVFAKAWRTWWFSVLAQLQRNDKLPVVVYHTLWIDHYAKAESRTGEGGLFAANLQHTCCPGLGPRSLCGCWRRKKRKSTLLFLWLFSNMSLIETEEGKNDTNSKTNSAIHHP